MNRAVKIVIGIVVGLFILVGCSSFINGLSAPKVEEPTTFVDESPVVQEPTVTYITVPELRNLTGDMAQSVLYSLELNIELQSNDGSIIDNPAEWTVTDQDHQTGEQVTSGTTIVLTLTKTYIEPPVVEPAPVVPEPAPPVVQPAPPSSVYYENCDAVRAAGAAPIHSGDPGYSSKLDRDGDGIGCE